MPIMLYTLSAPCEGLLIEEILTRHPDKVLDYRKKHRANCSICSKLDSDDGIKIINIEAD